MVTIRTEKLRSGILIVLDRLGSRGDYVFAFLAYVLLTILFTWPLAANFTSYVNGNVQDVYHELWYLHTFGTFGGNTPFGPFDNFFTNQILYPYGVPLYFQVTSPLNTIAVSILSGIIGFIPSYNVVYMASFFVGAFTMYILAKYLTGNKYAAFFAGIVYGFAPVHDAQALAHLNIISSELIPLFVYFLIRMAREQKFRNAILAGIVLVLNAMLDLHQLLMCLAILVAFLVFYLFWIRREVLNKPFIERLFVLIAIAGLLGLAFYFNTFYGLLFAPKSLGASAAATTIVTVHNHRSADIVQFFLPTPTNPIFGRFTFPTYHALGTLAEVQTYFGWTALILALVGIAANYKNRKVLFFGFVALIGFTLALGPYIVVNGTQTNIPGVWYYFYYLVPFFKSFRTPYRFDIIVMLAIAVLSAYGLTKILSSIPRGSSARTGTIRRVILVAIVCSLLIIEFLPIPYPELFAAPPTYLQILANDHSSYAVVDVPANPKIKLYLYYSTYYDHPVVTGHISRTPIESLSFLQETPFINLLDLKSQIKGVYRTYTHLPLEPNLVSNLTISQVREITPYILAQYNIKYIIFHRDLMTPNLYGILENFTYSVLGPPIYQDNVITMFEFTPPQGLGLTQYAISRNMPYYAELYGGWYKPQSITTTGATGKQVIKNFQIQSMDFLAGVNVYASSDQMMQVVFSMKSGSTADYPIQVSVNGKIVGTYMAVTSGGSTTGFVSYSTPFMLFSKGLNQVTFYSPKGCGPAVTFSTTKAANPKNCISAAFHSLAVIVAPPIPGTTRI